jgi:hypothetical protein
LKYKLDEFVQKNQFILSNNSSSSSSLLDPNKRPLNWTEQQMHDFFIDKIIKDKTSLLITNADEIQIKLMNRNTMNDRFTEFIQILRKKHYDIKKIKKYYIPNKFNVDIGKRIIYRVTVPWYAEDCFDFIKYATYHHVILFPYI